MRWKVVGEPFRIHRGLRFNAGKCPLGLCLNSPNSLTIKVQQIISEPEASLHRKLTDSNSTTSQKVHVTTALDVPSSCDKLLVNFLSGFLFWRFNHITALKVMYGDAGFL
jgi:hypothetical protein